MNTRYCPECGYAMVPDIDKEFLWCPVCNIAKKIKKGTVNQEKIGLAKDFAFPICYLTKQDCCR